MADSHNHHYYGRLRRPRRWRLPAVPATWALVFVNILIFVTGRLFSPGDQGTSIWGWAEFHPVDLWGGAWWQAITAAFVHSSVSHLAGNLVVLLIVGYALEPVLGGRRLLFAYVLTALGGSLAELLLSPSSGRGASGALSGLIGVYLAIVWRRRELWWRRWPIGHRWLWTLCTLWLIGRTWGQEGIGYLAHAGGLLAGLGYGAGLPLHREDAFRRWRTLRRRRAALAAALAAAVLVAAFSFWQPGWWLARAQTAARSGDWASARTHLFAVQACAHPDVYEDAFTMARACTLSLAHRDSLRARELMEPACRTLELSVCYRKLGDLQSGVLPYEEHEALGNYRMALALDPEYVPAMLAIAWLHLTAEDSTVRDPARAMKMARRAIAATSGVDADVLGALAEAQHQNGDTPGAIRSLEAALRLEPHEREYWEGELARIREEASAAGQEGGSS